MRIFIIANFLSICLVANTKAADPNELLVSVAASSVVSPKPESVQKSSSSITSSRKAAGNSAAATDIVQDLFIGMTTPCRVTPDLVESVEEKLNEIAPEVFASAVVNQKIKSEPFGTGTKQVMVGLFQEEEVEKVEEVIDPITEQLSPDPAPIAKAKTPQPQPKPRSQAIAATPVESCGTYPTKPKTPPLFGKIKEALAKRKLKKTTESEEAKSPTLFERLSIKNRAITLEK